MMRKIGVTRHCEFQGISARESVPIRKSMCGRIHFQLKIAQADLYYCDDGDGYLAFIGRICPEITTGLGH